MNPEKAIGMASEILREKYMEEIQKIDLKRQMGMPPNWVKSKKAQATEILRAAQMLEREVAEMVDKNARI